MHCIYWEEKNCVGCETKSTNEEIEKYLESKAW